MGLGHGNDLNAEMKKKLIEVALPLEAINKEAAREKSIRHGHPSTLHLWWARRPLAACRAVLFASLIDDPSSRPEEFPTEADQDRERQRLFRLIEELVKWDNSNNKLLLDAAHQEILKSTDGAPPAVYDPFCGGGSIPLEAQQLGLESHASDLNPVAVLITKALIEIPPKFSGQPPVHPTPQGRVTGAGMWPAARGLAEDVRYYGRWMRALAQTRIGHLYPKAKLPKELGGGEATVIAWLWARTVLCPNPACGGRMPLVRSFALSTKQGKEACVLPVVDASSRTVRFEISNGNSAVPKGTVDRRGARCLICGAAVPFEHVRSEGRAGRMSAQLMALVADGMRTRIFLKPTAEHEAIAAEAEPVVAPETDLPAKALGFRVQVYGMTRHRDLFTHRQLVTLTTFSDLVRDAREQAITDGASSDYADSLATYLAFGIDKLATTNCSICSWQTDPTRLTQAFSRQAIPMVWDYAEANPFSGAAGDYELAVDSVGEVLDRLQASTISGSALQRDAQGADFSDRVIFSTDPPYYDNIGYADLSDFFYVWLRRSLSSIYPDIFSTLLVLLCYKLDTLS
jgi:putative DNA methylase